MSVMLLLVSLSVLLPMLLLVMLLMALLVVLSVASRLAVVAVLCRRRTLEQGIHQGANFDKLDNVPVRAPPFYV